MEPKSPKHHPTWELTNGQRKEVVRQRYREYIDLKAKEPGLSQKFYAYCLGVSRNVLYQTIKRGVEQKWDN